MDPYRKPLPSNEIKLWEGTPSKEVGKQTFRLVTILTFVFILPMILIFTFSLWDFIGTSFIPTMLFALIPGLFGFLILIILLMYKNFERDKWKNERYFVSDKRITKTSSMSMFIGSRMETTQSISIDELLQYSILMSVGDRLFKRDTAMVSFYTEYTSYPKLFFSHISEPYKLKEILDSLMLSKRKESLIARAQSPHSTIDWSQEFDGSGNLLVSLVKIGLVWFAFLAPYFLFRSLFLFLDLNFTNLDQIYVYFFTLPLAGLCTFYLLSKCLKNASANYSLNNIGVYKEREAEYLFELQKIQQFVIRPSIIGKFLRHDSPTIYLYPDITGKNAFKIPFAKNYEKLREQLTDVLLLRAGATFSDELLERETAPPIDIQVEELAPDLEQVSIDIGHPALQYLQSYLTPQEHVLKIFHPNLSSFKKNLFLTLTPLFVLILLPFVLMWVVFSFMGSLMTVIPLLLAIIILPIMLCSLGGQIYMYFQLKKTEYIITTQKLIIKTDKKIEFVPLETIETLSISRRASDKIFKLDAANIYIRTKQMQRVMFAKMVRFYILNSIDQPDEIEDIIMKAKNY